MAVTYTALARRYGHNAGLDAASWLEITDNAHAARLLRMIENGDPAVEYWLPREPTLSGEYADDYTESDLLRDIGYPGDFDTLAADGYVTAYLDAASVAYWRAIEGTLRAQLGRAGVRAALAE